MKTIWIILLSACVGALLNGMLMRSCQTEIPPQPQIIRDTTIVVQIDTQYFLEPVPYKVEVKDTVYIEKGYTGHVFVQEKKWFGDGETYDMQVSGINVQLEWIKTYPKTVTEYVYETKTIMQNSPKWSLWFDAKYGKIGDKSSMPIGVEIRYCDKPRYEYFVKAGKDVIGKSDYIMLGGRVRAFPIK